MLRSKLSYLSQTACAAAMVFGLLGAAHAQVGPQPMDPSKIARPALRPGEAATHIAKSNANAPNIATGWYAFRCSADTWYWDGTNYWIYAWDFDIGVVVYSGINSPFQTAAEAILIHACRNGSVYFVYVYNTGGGVSDIQVGN